MSVYTEVVEHANQQYSPQERFNHAVNKLKDLATEKRSLTFDIGDDRVRLCEFLAKKERDRFVLYTFRDESGPYVELFDKSDFAYLYTEQEVKKGQIPAECST